MRAAEVAVVMGCGGWWAMMMMKDVWKIGGRGTRRFKKLSPTRSDLEIFIFPDTGDHFLPTSLENACEKWTTNTLPLLLALPSAKSGFVRYHGQSGRLCPLKHPLTMINSGKDPGQGVRTALLMGK